MRSEGAKDLAYYHVGFATLCICMLMLSYLYIIHTSSEQTRTQEALEQTLLAVKQQQQDLAAQHQQLSQSVAELETQSDSRAALLPLSALNERSADIVSMAEESQMQVDSFSPSDKDTHGDIAYQSFQLQGVATFDQLIDFLNAVASQMHDVHMTDIKLSDTDQLSDKLTIDLRMKWYIRRDE